MRTSCMQRIFHPVGQGAFFTEVFKDATGKVTFTVVYDCGTDSNMSLLKREITDVFADVDHIDFLFFSHFDRDHVNGYEELVNLKLITDKTKIFIPFVDDNFLGLYDTVNTTQCANFKSNLLGNKYGAQVIQVGEPDDENNNETLTPVTIDELLKNKNYNPNQGVIIPNCDWLYFPFMITDEETKVEIGKEIMKEECWKTIDWNNLPLKDEKFIKRIKPLFKKIGNSHGPSTISNMNSLSLLSKPACERNDICEPSDYIYECRCRIPNLYYNPSIDKEDSLKGCKCWHPHFFGCEGCPGSCLCSCLYNGDVNLQEDLCYKKMKDFAISHNCNAEIGFFQIPHHGSKNSYNHQIPGDNFYNIAFTNFDIYYPRKIFDANVLFDFILARRELVMITEDPNSIVKQDIFFRQL